MVHLHTHTPLASVVCVCNLRVVPLRWSALGLCCVFVCVCVFAKCLGLCPWYFLGFTQALFHKRRSHLIFLLAKISPIHSLVLTSTLQMSKWRGTTTTCIYIHTHWQQSHMFPSLPCQPKTMCSFALASQPFLRILCVSQFYGCLAYIVRLKNLLQ